VQILNQVEHLDLPCLLQVEKYMLGIWRYLFGWSIELVIQI